MVGDIGERAARKPPLGGDERLVPDEPDHGGDRAAAQDIEDERVGFAPACPNLRLRAGDRLGHHLQLGHFCGIGGLVARGYSRLEALQVLGHCGKRRRVGRLGARRQRRGGRDRAERQTKAHEPPDGPEGRRLAAPWGVRKDASLLAFEWGVGRARARSDSEPPHGFASRKRISIRRFCAASGWAGSFRR